MLSIKAIVNSLLVVHDAISGQDQIDYIIDYLLEEENPYIMQLYGNFDSITLYDVEALIYVQESHLDKFLEDLVVFEYHCEFS